MLNPLFDAFLTCLGIPNSTELRSSRPPRLVMVTGRDMVGLLDSGWLMTDG